MESESRSLFGQVKKEKARSSLKAGLIRTGQEGKGEMESESRSYSDRLRRKGKERDGVRKPAQFGQGKKKITRSSLNVSSLEMLISPSNTKNINILFVIRIACISK